MTTVDLTGGLFERIGQGRSSGSTSVEFGAYLADVTFGAGGDVFHIYETPARWLGSLRDTSSEGARRLQISDLALNVRLRYEGMPIDAGALFEVEEATVNDAKQIFANLSDEDVAYAASRERGEHVGFAALHDRMDANMLLPMARQADASGLQWLDRANAAMKTFNAMLPAVAENRISRLRADEHDRFQRKYGFASRGNALTGHEFLLETHGADLDVVRAAKPQCVWTLVEGDGGATYLMAGIHKVNRLNFIISEKPWLTGCEKFSYQNGFPEEESLEVSPDAAEITLARLTDLVELACGKRDHGIDDEHWDELESVAVEARTVLNSIQKQQETGAQWPESHGLGM